MLIMVVQDYHCPGSIVEVLQVTLDIIPTTPSLTQQEDGKHEEVLLFQKGVCSFNYPLYRQMSLSGSISHLTSLSEAYTAFSRN